MLNGCILMLLPFVSLQICVLKVKRVRHSSEMDNLFRRVPNSFYPQLRGLFDLVRCVNNEIKDHMRVRQWGDMA